MRALRRATSDSAPLFSLEGRRFRCKIVDVYDGDTCTAVFFLDGKLRKFKIRMNGYDSPEMKPRKNIPNRADVIRHAHEAKEALIGQVGNGLVEVACRGWDKYGRLLGTIWVARPQCGCQCGSNNVNVNEWMVENGFGYEYDGGTKRKPEEATRI
jgi:micrococcal nuclease